MGEGRRKHQKVVKEHGKLQEAPPAELQDWQESIGLLTETHATVSTLLRAVKQEAQNVL